MQVTPTLTAQTLATMDFTPQNTVQHDEDTLGFSERLAMRITLVVSTMYCTYAFIVLAIVGFPGAHASLHDLIQWVSQTFLQLVFLPILSVSSAVISRRQDKAAAEQYRTTCYLMNHLSGQDAELLKQSTQIAQVVTAVETIANKDLVLDEDTHADLQQLIVLVRQQNSQLTAQVALLQTQVAYLQQPFYNKLFKRKGA
jgi:hypothetical protein